MTTQDFHADLDALAEGFKQNVRIEDRKYLLKTYKDCFVGKEAVDYLVKSGAAPSRQDAVELGKALQSTFLFEHVTRDHQFSDDYLFFRFLEKGERGEFKVDGATGEKIDWSSLLSPPVSSTGPDQPWQPKFRTPDLEVLHPKDVHVASQVWPMDKYNTTLLNHVHPLEWQDPTAGNRDGSSTYDLVVIGGGTGGLIAASGSAGVGARVAMIEEHMLGGDWYVASIGAPSICSRPSNRH
jgi:Domain found in Dishevelled, Egl-10, and Pleckstrin (DEP)